MSLRLGGGAEDAGSSSAAVRHAPGDEHAGSGQARALGCHAAEACPEDQAEQNDAQCVDGMTEKDAHSLQESDLDHHETDPDQGEIDGAAHDQIRVAVELVSSIPGVSDL